MPPSGWELHARAGRPVLVRDTGREVDPARLPLPAPLITALHEWARVADTLSPGTAEPDTAELLAHRGRRLAARLSVETGREIDFRDPLSGRLDRVGRRHAATRVAPLEDLPTPWGPGLTSSAIIAVIAATTLVVVTRGLADVSVLLGIGVNLAVVAGFAPSIWLGRNVPVWRWIAYGAAAGIGAAWLVLILSTLG
ncbi:DUF2537 domain-containing protein [Saccharopolyspora sp. CA-218241]|uniref:DUF2537 domain-containing protein n=1 Tax=Saccharopolyspora sp. CA-218241 TaxID=3240027 RepID=UPI003D957C92